MIKYKFKTINTGMNTIKNKLLNRYLKTNIATYIPAAPPKRAAMKILPSRILEQFPSDSEFLWERNNKKEYTFIAK